AGYVNTLNAVSSSIHFGAWCDGRDAANAAPNAGNLTQIANADPTRYFFKSPFCAGDEDQNGTCYNESCLPAANYGIVGPDGNDAVCSGPQEQNPLDIPGEAPTSGGTLSATAAKYFERLVPLCTISTSANGDYKVIVTSNQGKGNNQFSLLALHQQGSAPPK